MWLLILSIVFLPTFVFANCQDFLDSRLETMNLGKLNSPACGVIKSAEGDKLRISLSKVKGRKDLGPTISMYSSDKENIKVVQLLSKDRLTSHRQKFTYILGSNCNEVKSVTYSLGSLMSEVTLDKCEDIDKSFSQEEQVYLSVSRICSTFFEQVQKSNTSNLEINKTHKIIKQ